MGAWLVVVLLAIFPLATAGFCGLLLPCGLEKRGCVIVSRKCSSGSRATSHVASWRSSSTDTFRTEVKVQQSSRGICLDDRVTLVGSCFSENIAGKLRDSKFRVDVNPFGTSFHPLSIAWCLDRLLSGRPFKDDELQASSNGMWFSYQHHTSFSSPDKDTCLSAINQRLKSARSHTMSAKLLCITLGSAWAYVLRETGQVVANCHKMPQGNFEKRLVPAGECAEGLIASIKAWNEAVPGLHCIITVSPVRHWKDGAVGNSLSKATLVSAAHIVVDRLKAKVSYFPSYEIMNDDLRDYRFYSSDMLHPSDVAVDYIWSKFASAWLKPSCASTMGRIERVVAASRHRPFNLAMPAHQRFLAETLEEISSLQEQFPHMDFERELSILQDQLYTLPATSSSWK